MRRTVMLMGLVVVMVLIAAVVAAEPNLNPGKWEISTEVDMPGMPMKMPPVTHIQCLTKEDFVPKGKAESDNCKITDIKEDGDTVSWKMSCSGEGGEMQGKGRISYGGDTMEGTVDMVMPGAGMTVKNIMKGKRIGDCD